jgi:hypothetical protein
MLMWVENPAGRLDTTRGSSSYANSRESAPLEAPRSNDLLGTSKDWQASLRAKQFSGFKPWPDHRERKSSSWKPSFMLGERVPFVPASINEDGLLADKSGTWSRSPTGRTDIHKPDEYPPNANDAGIDRLIMQTAFVPKNKVAFFSNSSNRAVTSSRESINLWRVQSTLTENESFLMRKFAEDATAPFLVSSVEWMPR